MRKLRYYQRRAVDRAFAAWEQHRCVLLVAATGTGKTVTFNAIAKRVMDGGIGRVIIVANRRELVMQTAKSVRFQTGYDTAIEMGEQRTRDDMYGGARVVVASVQTLNSIRGGVPVMRKFDPSKFDLVVFDEAHHAIASSWRAVWDYFGSSPKSRLLGVTATPDRGDERALGMLFNCCADEYTIREGVADGFLVKPMQRVVHVEGLDFSHCRTTAGDLNGADLARVVEDEKPMQRMVVPYFEIAGNRRGIVFTSSVAQATLAAEILNRCRPGCAAVVSEKTRKDIRAEVFKDFDHGRIQHLVNVDIASEGWDDPALDGVGVQVVGMMRFTKSRAKYTQQAGRVLRPLPRLVDDYTEQEDAGKRLSILAASAKPSALLIDFMGLTGAHRLVFAGDILSGKFDPEDETSKTAAGLAASEGREVDPLEMMTEAEIIVREKREEEERRRRRRLVAKVRYSEADTDPFEFVGIAPPKTSGWRRTLAPTEAQVRVLENAKVPNIDTLNRDEASAIIDRLWSKPSPAQQWRLNKHGVDWKGADRKLASEAISALSQGQKPDVVNRWLAERIKERKQRDAGTAI